VFPHKLEHCVITGWVGTRVGADLFSVNISFARIKHYGD